MKTTTTFIVAILLGTSIVSFAQTPIIFQPAPGLNDTTDQGSITAGKDAWIYQGNPATNYGADPMLITTPISNCNNTHAIGLIQFDVSTLPQYVDSVKFGFTHLDHTSYCYSNCTADFYFGCVTQPWYESTVTYNSQPTYDTAFYGPVSISFPNSFGLREYDITSTYQLWRNGTIPNYGLAIFSTTVGCNNAAVMFGGSSSDDTATSKRPYLKIYSSGVGLNQEVNSLSAITVAPNPAIEQATLYFTLLHNNTAVISVTDPLGRKVTQDIVVSGQGPQSVTIDLSNCASGIYLYTLQTTEATFTGKLIH